MVSIEGVEFLLSLEGVKMANVVHSGVVKKPVLAKPALLVEEDDSVSFWSPEILDTLSVETLRDIAETLGISYTLKTKKSSLVSLISES